MFHKWMIVCLLLRLSSSLEKFDPNICPNGLTRYSSDSPWPKHFPNQFEIIAELTTDVQSFELTQIFLGPDRDMIHLRNSQINLQIYSDFELKERLIVNEESICNREEIQLNQTSPFFVSEYLKPSILFGFNQVNRYNSKFPTKYLGKTINTDGILVNKFQSCFTLEQFNLTINATYYLVEYSSTISDIIQIDVRTNDFPYTFNIIQYRSNPFLKINTPEHVFCPNRMNTKEFPINLPNNLAFHAEAYRLANHFIPSKIDSYNHFIDEYSRIERFDYTNTDLFTPSRLIIDYSTNLTYMYTHETQHCSILNMSHRSMGSMNEILFHIQTDNHSIEYQYTGLVDCGRDYLQCHRWIGRHEKENSIEEVEWYWTGKYHEMDMNQLIPIKLHLKTAFHETFIQEEIHIFDFHSLMNSIESYDSTIGDCYRSLGSNEHFNYTIVRLTFDNHANYSIHQYLLSFERDLHSQLANYLQIRSIRLSSFVIDILSEHDQDIYVTFTLLDNRFRLSNELSSSELINKLTRDINDEHFSVRVHDGGFDLFARINSLRILTFDLSSKQNRTIVNKHDQLIYSQIIALWTSSILLSLIGTMIIGLILVMKRWIPRDMINHGHIGQTF